MDIAGTSQLHKVLQGNVVNRNDYFFSATKHSEIIVSGVEGNILQYITKVDLSLVLFFSRLCPFLTTKYFLFCQSAAVN